MKVEKGRNLKISNKTYNVLKWIAQIVLPAVGTLYFGLSYIWGFPEADKVVGTITLVDTFLGVVLGISTVQYNKSTGSITNQDGYEYPKR